LLSRTFEGDTNHQVENQVRHELERLDTAFGVKIVSYQHGLSSQPAKEEVQAARALTWQARESQSADRRERTRRR